MSRLRRPSSRSHASSGMALALVLLMLAVTVVIGVCFLTSAGSSTSVSRLVDERLQARMIAESGLAIALSYIERDASWRTSRSSGQWVANEPFGGGTFSLWGEDGEDTNGDGTVEGSGSFTANPTGPVTFACVGEYLGVRHQIRVVYRPEVRSAVAVAERIELANASVLDSYNWQLGPYGAQNRGASAAASSNAIGQRNVRLSGDAVITGKLHFPKDTNPLLALDLTGNAKITGGTAALTVQEISLPSITVPSYTPSASDVTYNSATPATLSADVSCRNFSLVGASILKVVGNVRVFCEGNFLMDNTARLELANPHYGFDVPLGSSVGESNKKQIATQIVIPDAVEVRTIAAYLQNTSGSSTTKACRYGLYTDNNGEPGSLIVQSDNDYVTAGGMWYWHEIAVAPTKINPGTYWLAISVVTGVPNYAFGTGGKLRVKNHDAVDLGFINSWAGSDESYSRTLNIYLTGNVAGKGATLQVYTRGKLTIQGGAQLNTNTEVPSRVTFLHRNTAPGATGEALLRGTSISWATVHAPETTLRLSDTAQLNGIARPRDLLMEWGSVLRTDNSVGLANAAGPPLLVGETLVMRNTARIDGIGGGGAQAAVCTAGLPAVLLKGASVLKGDASVGPGGTAGPADIQVVPTASITGNRRVLAQAVPISMLASPSGLPLTSDVSVSEGTAVLASSFQCNNLTIEGTGTVEIRNDITIVVNQTARFQGFGRLRLAEGARLTLFIKGEFSPRDDASINGDGNPGAVAMYVSGDRIVVRNRARVCGTLIAPAAQVNVADDAHLFGGLLGRRLKLEGNGQMHADVRPVRVRWVEQQ